MRWLLLLACVAAQPALPLLPSGVTMSMVTRIDVEAPGAKVALIQEADGVDATITNRLSYSPVIKFDHATGTLTVTAVPASSSSMLKPGLPLDLFFFSLFLPPLSLVPRKGSREDSISFSLRHVRCLRRCCLVRLPIQGQELPLRVAIVVGSWSGQRFYDR